MSEIDNGGPAFPYVHETASDMPGMRAVYVERGMTMRDYFAAKAMQGLMAGEFTGSYEDFASHSYQVADAMLAERGKQK